MGEKSRYHHGNLRSGLIDAALVLLDEGGEEAVGIRQVARAVGVAHSAPANHFKNKRALYTSLASAIFQNLSELIQQEFKDKNYETDEGIRYFAKAILEFGLEYPNRYKLMWRRDFTDNDDSVLQSAMDEIYECLISLLSSYQRKQPIDVESQAIAIWSLIHGYVSLRLDGNLSAAKDQVTGLDRSDAVIEVILEGIL